MFTLGKKNKKKVVSKRLALEEQARRTALDILEQKNWLALVSEAAKKQDKLEAETGKIESIICD